MPKIKRPLSARELARVRRAHSLATTDHNITGDKRLHHHPAKITLPALERLAARDRERGGEGS